MRKIYSLVLMAAALLVGANAWATEIVVNDFAELKNALSASGTADVVKLGQNIAYSGTAVLNIERSLTLDGQGHKITGYGQLNTKVNIAATTNFNTVIAVNYQGNVASTLEVTIQNLYIGSTVNARHYGVMVYDGVKSLLLQNDSIVYTQGTTQPICVNGYQSTALELTINDSYIKSGPSGYCAYILKPIDATVTNSTIDGWAGFYFKPCNSTINYGNNIGSRGSKLSATATTFDCPNIHSNASNNFALFPIEEDGIEISLHNCTFNAETQGTTPQRFLNMQYQVRTSGFQPVKIKLTGDNTHLYNVVVDQVVFNGWAVGKADPGIGTTPDRTLINVPFTFTIEAGTYSFDPSAVHWYQYGDEVTGNLSEQMDGTGAITTPSGYEVQPVSQGGTTVYRVVKKAAEKTPGVLYDLNDLVAGEGVDEGNNPVSSFELSTGSEMTLDQETTTAGYVQVKEDGSGNGTTVTVGTNTQDQTLIINNGLDVQGTSKVDVQPGSALVVGDGGIVTENSGNIVLNADANDGCASLLLDPTVTVNQTPELTVMMKAEQVGLYNAEYYWHRFAMPVASISALPHTPNTATAIYGWDYNAQNWYALSGLNQLVPFAGYALTVNGDRQDVTYTFQGNLTGNINTDLAFSHQGYNFFGNSYTGYIKVSYLANEIIGNADIDASIWMWNPTTQSYAAVGLQALKDAEDGGYATAMYSNWQREIAPMQTFILRLPNTTSATAEVDYATTIWSNPRYGNASPAPARANAEIEGTIVRLSVADANGNSDEMLFMEKDSYSDAYDRGYDATKYMNSNNMNMYTLQNGEKLSAVATDNLNGKSFDIETKGAISYTLIFDAVLGETNYAVRDNVTGATIAMNQGSTYTFTAQPNSTVAGRFTFVPVQNMPTDVETVEANSNVRGIYTITGQYVGEDFDILPAGVYVVDGVKIVK